MNTARCVRCNRLATAPQDDLNRFFRACINPGRILLGDRVERWLTTIGITQERYVRWKGRLAGKKCSDCEQRKAWLNSIRWLNSVSDPQWWRRKLRRRPTRIPTVQRRSPRQ